MMLERHPQRYRLGLDLGSNSLGWFVTNLQQRGDRFEPVGLGPGGVRIFPDGRDPQSKASNAVDRRMARGARKRRDRFVLRRSQLMDALVRNGLMPQETAARKALAGLDPYQLRARALVDSLPAHLGGALGVRTWTLLPSEADWRWMRGRDDSPWYPTMRLFRQRTAGDWGTAIAPMAQELRQATGRAV
jgi:CRISPR-associated endonuclease Csn1